MKVYPLEVVKVEKDVKEDIRLPSLDEYVHHYSWDVRCMFYWESYKWLIIFLITCAIIAIVTASIVLTRSSSGSTTSSSNPCSAYVQNDLASSVTLECFRYIWQNAGCKTLVPNGYNGFWLRSPSGGKTVLCIPPNVGDQCGAGSYSYIINNVYTCVLDYRGY